MSENEAACAHSHVSYKRIDNLNGTCSASWRCDSGCGAYFWPSMKPPNTLMSRDEPRKYPMPCGLCDSQIESSADTEWHGLGNCVPICERCTGSGIEPPVYTAAPPAETPNYEHLFNRIMSCLRNLKMKHGKCEPRELRACTHCNAQDDLDKMVAEYKGARVFAAAAPQSDPRPTCSYWTDKQEGDVIKRYFCMLEPGHNDEHMLTTGLTVGRRLAPQSHQPSLAETVAKKTAEIEALGIAKWQYACPHCLEGNTPIKSSITDVMVHHTTVGRVLCEGRDKPVSFGTARQSDQPAQSANPLEPTGIKWIDRDGSEHVWPCESHHGMIIYAPGTEPHVASAADNQGIMFHEVAAPAPQPVAPAQPTEAELYGGEERYDGPRGALMQIKKKSSPGANAEEVLDKMASLLGRSLPHDMSYGSDGTRSPGPKDAGRLWHRDGNCLRCNLVALLESFRAETLEQAIHICEYAARGTVEKMSRGDKSETWKIIAQNSVEQYESIVKRIRDLRADPNWLARQIAEAQIAELDALETVMDEAGMLAEWGSVAQIRYKNRRRAALAATKSQLTEGK